MILVVILIIAILWLTTGGSEDSLEKSPIVVSEKHQIQLAELGAAVFRTQKDLDLWHPGNLGEYIFAGCAGVCRQQLHIRLGELGLKYVRPKDAEAKKYILIHAEQEPGIKRFRYDVQSFMRNVLNVKELRAHIGKPYLPIYFADFIPKTINLKPGAKFPGGVWIAKPDGQHASSGFGINIIESQKQLDSWIQKTSANRMTTGMVLCEYIRNPRLWQGRKFHYRCYILLTSWGTWSICPIAKIITAAKPYKDSNYSDKGIHDSHIKSTPQDITEMISDKLRSVLEKITAKMSEIPHPAYSDNDSGYHVLAPDIIDTGDEILLLEINSSPGVGTIDDGDTIRAFEKIYYDWIFDSISDKLAEFVGN